MSFFTVTQVNLTRKPCLCYWCPEHIEVGQPKIKTATVWEGDFQWNNFHPECFDALQAWQELPENKHEYEWPEQGEMKRGTTEPR